MVAPPIRTRRHDSHDSICQALIQQREFFLSQRVINPLVRDALHLHHAQLRAPRSLMIKWVLNPRLAQLLQRLMHLAESSHVPSISIAQC